MPVPTSPTPPPEETLRRTRPWFLAAGGLLALWMLLAMAFVLLTTRHHAEITGEPFGPLLLQNPLAYGVAAYVAAHAYVGRKLLQLARAARQTDPAEGRAEAARAFAGFWRVNLRTHLLLWGILAVFILLTFLLRR